jgi:hypothetical protein
MAKIWKKSARSSAVQWGKKRLNKLLLPLRENVEREHMPVQIFDFRILAHCRMCYEPMCFIYDSNLRDYCYECTVESGLDKMAKSKIKVAGAPYK